MFIMDVLETGARGFDLTPMLLHDRIEDPQAYGIDWEELDELVHRVPGVRNAQLEELDPADTDVEANALNEEDVPVDPPPPNLTEIEQSALAIYLAQHLDFDDSSMVNRRRLWGAALAFSNAIVAERRADAA
jgi:hypothetical protein